MDRLILDDDERVCAWLEAQMGYSTPTLVRPSIGFERDGEVMAAVVFDNLSDNNVFAHIVSQVKTGVPPGLLRACWMYAFEQLKLGRVSLLVAANNDRAVRFISKWGAKFEARLERGTKAADLLIFVVWREDVAMKDRLYAERSD